MEPAEVSVAKPMSPELTALAEETEEALSSGNYPKAVAAMTKAIALQREAKEYIHMINLEMVSGCEQKWFFPLFFFFFFLFFSFFFFY
jgi:hypothetical protein